MKGFLLMGWCILVCNGDLECAQVHEFYVHMRVHNLSFPNCS